MASGDALAALKLRMNLGGTWHLDLELGVGVGVGRRAETAETYLFSWFMKC